MSLNMSPKKHISVALYFNGQTYANSTKETMLGIIIDNKISFYSHITGLCEEPPQKLSSFSRVALHLLLIYLFIYFIYLIYLLSPSKDVLTKNIEQCY